MVLAVRSAVIYARISADHEQRALGVARQVEECRRLAAQRGWRVGAEYVDNDQSAYSGKRRPGYEQMMEDLKAGEHDAVIVWHQDRLTRAVRELEDFLDLYERVPLRGYASVSGGEYDLASSDGRCMARVQAVFARKESDDKSRRLRAKHSQLAEAGAVSGGGNRPYGYAPDRVTKVPEEAAVIRKAAKRVLAGESLRSVCADLNEAGTLTATGGEWKPSTLTRMLRSGRIAGLREHRGEIVGKAVWPAIIDRRTHDRLVALLSDPERRTSRPARRYVLAGLLRCGKCESVLVSRPRPDGTRRYVCASGPGHGGCGGIAIAADPLEAWIAEAVVARLDTPRMARVIEGTHADDDAAAEAQAELVAAQARMDELAEMFAAGEIGRREWLTARAPIETRVERARKRVARHSRAPILDGYIGHGEALQAEWDGLTLSIQQAIIAAAMDHAVIRPAVPGRAGFDRRRVRPVWR